MPRTLFWLQPLAALLLAAMGCVRADAGEKKMMPFQDAQLTVAQRVDDLIGRLKTDEKIALLMMESPAIPRLGVPAYHWWNEALHGVARHGIATVFPQPIGLAATWDENLLREVAGAIATEARAHNNDALARGERGIYSGLTIWSPNVNIFRDPRWGRGQETYGEDPFLTARMGVAFVKGLQGDDPNYFKTIATPKHFAAHSGPEALRQGFSAQVTPHDLWDTYLPAFEACVREGKAHSVMAAYSAINGVSCSANKWLLNDVLRTRWGFDGVVVSDVDSIGIIDSRHQHVKSPQAAAAAALTSGLDLNSGYSYRDLGEALKEKLIKKQDIDRALARVLEARFRLGEFDPPEQVPWRKIPHAVNASKAHEALALRAARESLVLLRNPGGVLPLSKAMKRVAVIGPNAADGKVLLGNYKGFPRHQQTILDSIREKLGSGVEVLYAKGCDGLEESSFPPAAVQAEAFTAEAAAAELARQADAVILVMGINPRLEGEEMPLRVQGLMGGDRTRLDLPGAQQRLIRAVAAAGKPTALVVLSGSGISMSGVPENVAILQAWYPGQAAGAVADVLFGDISPAGRMPVTVYKSTADLPPFTDYGMAGRTYRYFKGEPEFAFGDGLTYSTFAYGMVLVPDSIQTGENLTIEFDVENIGGREAEDVTQLYLTHEDAPAGLPVPPIRSLVGFKRVGLKHASKATVAFTVTPYQLGLVDEEGKRKVYPGTVTLAIGPNQRDTIKVPVIIEGEAKEVEYGYVAPELK